MKKIIFLLALAMLISGCATSYYLNKADYLNKLYSDGQISYEEYLERYNNLIAQAEYQQRLGRAIYDTSSSYGSNNYNYNLHKKNKRRCYQNSRGDTICEDVPDSY